MAKLNGKHPGKGFQCLSESTEGSSANSIGRLDGHSTLTQASRLDLRYRPDVAALPIEMLVCLLHELKDYLGATAIGARADPLISCASLSLKRAGDL